MPTITLGNPARFWNKPIPGLGFMDKPFAAGAGMVGGAAKWTGNRMMGGLKGVGKGAAIAGGLAMGIYAASSLVNAVRGGREDEPEPQKPQPTMVDPYAEMGLIPPEMAMGAPQQETMMGMAPVEGTFVQRLKAGRGGRDVAMGNPNPNAPDVDGRPVQDMGSIGMGR